MCRWGWIDSEPYTVVCYSPCDGWMVGIYFNCLLVAVPRAVIVAYIR